MRRTGTARVRAALVTLLVILVTAGFLRSPGTEDVVTWERWAGNSDALGAVAGYAANNADYPPNASVILLSAVRVSRLFGIGTFGAIKLVIFVFLCLTSTLFWLWTRDFIIAVILHLSLLLNSVALGYLDVFFAPSFILSMWALKEHKLTLFAVCYSLACLTKWQPIIIAPFLVAYIVNISNIAHWKQVDFKKLTQGVVLPAIAILLLTLAIFGAPALRKSLLLAANHDFLSGDALNFNWILTHVLHVFYPATFGGLIEGEATNIRTKSLAITAVPRLLFVLFYAITLVSFFRRDETFEVAVRFSLIGYLAYFIFNTGVHENHLFLPVIVSIILLWIDKKYLPVTVTVVAMSNINLFLFYGRDGTGLGFSRAIAKAVDTALLLSLFNVGFFLLLFARLFWRGGDARRVPGCPG